MFLLIIITLLTGVAGIGLGGLIGALLGGISKKVNAIILSFSAGTMISLICYELIEEAMESGLSLYMTAFIVLISSLAVCLLDYFIDSREGHTDDFIACEDCDEKGMSPNRMNTKMRTKKVVRQRSKALQLMLAGLMMAAAVAIHNIPEGMSIGAIYAREGLDSSLLVLLFTIILHNIPEGMAITSSLTSSGMDRLKAVGVAAVTGLPTTLGAIIGYLIGCSEDSLLPAFALAFAAGTLAYVVFGEILPQSIKQYSSRKTAYAAIIGFAIGLIIIGGHAH
ncbi:MAG: ZIP family metal transporter [Eubacteriales bacterium]|nr:ZIP family metal transporter [Eubacteriales bacterium]